MVQHGGVKNTMTKYYYIMFYTERKVDLLDMIFTDAHVIAVEAQSKEQALNDFYQYFPKDYNEIVHFFEIDKESIKLLDIISNGCLKKRE